MRACRKRNQGVQPPCYMSHSCWVTLKTWGKKKHPGLSWAGLQHSGSVLLKKSPRLLKYLQAQFLSPWKFHCCVVWYVIQQNKIFPVNVLNMCSANQLVQRPAASTDETACIPSCSCFTLPSNEPLEIAVPSFAAFMKDRERKAEGTESFWGAEAASPVLCACSCVQNRERWFCCRGVKVLLAWSRGDQKGEFSLRVLVHQFAIQKTVLPSLKSWSLRREIRDGPSLADSCGWGRASDRKARSESHSHLWLAGSVPEPKLKPRRRFSGLRSGWVESPAKPRRFPHFLYNLLGEASKTPQAEIIPTASWNYCCDPEGTKRFFLARRQHLWFQTQNFYLNSSRLA